MIFMISQDIDLRQKIPKKAYDLFKKFGIRYVTMDLIAEQLGMSKKTLYVHFDNKRDLILHALEDHSKRKKEKLEVLFRDTSNVVEGLILVMRQVIDEVDDQNPVMLEELYRYYPEIAQKMEPHRRDENYKKLLDLIENGKKQKLFRQDVDSDIVAKLFLAEATNVIDTDLFPIRKYPRSKLIEHIFINFLRGIATPKGIDVLEETSSEII